MNRRHDLRQIIRTAEENRALRRELAAARAENRQLRCALGLYALDQLTLEEAATDYRAARDALIGAAPARDGFGRRDEVCTEEL